MSKFTLFEKTVSFAESADRYYAVSRQCCEALIRAEESFLDFYRVRGSVRAVLEKYMEAAGVITLRCAVEELYKNLPQLGIYDVTADAFKNACLLTDEAANAFNTVADKHNEVVGGPSIEKLYRAPQEISDGGFGGTIKGTAAIGAMNVLTVTEQVEAELFPNALVATSAKDRFYQNRETYRRLWMGVRNSVVLVYTKYMEFVNRYFESKGDWYFTDSCYDEEKAKALFQNAKNIPEKREELLMEAAGVCPYYADMLAYIFEQYPQERKNVCAFADFYQIDISLCYERLFREMYTDAQATEENELLAVRARIRKDMETYGIRASVTLEQVEQTYMELVCKKYYATALPGDRDAVLTVLRNFETTESLKCAFVSRNDIWELAAETGAVFPEEKILQLLQNAYRALRENNAPEEKIQRILQEMLVAFGKQDAAQDKETFLLNLCGTEEIKKSVSQTAYEKKETLLTQISEHIQYTVSIHSIAEKPYLEYHKGEANASAQKLQFVTLAPGEYVLMFYFTDPNPEKKYQSGFVLTDKRLVCKGCGDFQVWVQDAPVFKTGSFLSNSVVAAVVGKELELAVNNLSGKKHLAECFNQVFQSLAALQESLKLVDTELIEDWKEQRMQRIQAESFLVRCFGLQERAAQLIAEGEAAVRQRKLRQIDCLMQAVQPGDPGSVADGWVRLCNSGYEPELYVRQLEELYNYLSQTAREAGSVVVLKQVEAARESILPFASEEKMQALKAAVEGRWSEAERLDEQRRQKALAMQIRGECNLNQLESVIAGWERFVQSDCEESTYREYLQELDAAIRHLLAVAGTIPAVTYLRDQLSENNAERYAEHIQLAQEKLQALDIAQRTYQGILFDSLDELAYAREAEQKLDIIMRTVAPDDEASVGNAIKMISECPSKIKQIYLEKLNGYKENIGLQKRTFRDVVYETPELAAEAQRVYVAARAIVDELDWNIETDVELAYQRIGAMNHPITEEPLVKLKERLIAFDEQKRTVDGILFETMELANAARTEYAYIREQMAGFNENDEAVMLAIRENVAGCTTEIKTKCLQFIDSKLSAYDIRLRTFHDTVYETRELAQKLREEEVMVRDIMAPADENNEASMLTALAALQELSTFLKERPMAVLQSKLEEYDVRMRTVEGVTYNTREEAQLVSAELRRAAEIMQTVSATDEQSILNAQQAILELTTFVKDERYAQLNQMWEAYDVRMRTYKDILFGTRAQAQAAAKAHADFVELFNSLDLSQRRSLTTLDNFVEDRIPQEIKPYIVQMVEDVRQVLDRLDYIVQRDAAIDMATQKKESADLYQCIEDVLPKMTRYRMNTERIVYLKDKHYASLNPAKKLFSFFKKK